METKEEFKKRWDKIFAREHLVLIEGKIGSHNPLEGYGGEYTSDYGKSFNVFTSSGVARGRRPYIEFKGSDGKTFDLTITQLKSVIKEIEKAGLYKDIISEDYVQEIYKDNRLPPLRKRRSFHRVK